MENEYTKTLLAYVGPSHGWKKLRLLNFDARMMIKILDRVAFVGSYVRSSPLPYSTMLGLTKSTLEYKCDACFFLRLDPAGHYIITRTLSPSLPLLERKDRDGGLVTRYVTRCSSPSRSGLSQAGPSAVWSVW